MDLKQQCIFIILLLSIRNGITQKSCGNLKLHCSGTTCSIRLYPSTEMDWYIKQELRYRWIFDSNKGTTLIIIQKNVAVPPTFDTSKYSEDNFTLQIFNVDQSDEGIYKVQCFTDGHNPEFAYSTIVELRQPPPVTTSKLPTDNNATNPPIVDKTIIVTIAVCSVIIVIIISATVCIVIRRKTPKTEASKRLVSRDVSSEPAHGQRVQSIYNVYNEIDVEAESGAAAVVHPTTHKNVQPSVAGKAEKRRTENVYDLIAEEEIDSNVHIETNKNPRKRECNDIPVYAKVNKARKNEKEWFKDDHDAGYVIMFPKIDCAEINTSLGKDYEAMSYPAPEHPKSAYVNLVSRSQRLKSRKARNSSRKELQYAILDHTDSDNDSVMHIIKEEDSTNLRPCQYALIDFNKKAFIAPIRKAPSSWYKRKNKKASEKRKH